MGQSAQRFLFNRLTSRTKAGLCIITLVITISIVFLHTSKLRSTSQVSMRVRITPVREFQDAVISGSKTNISIPTTNNVTSVTSSREKTSNPLGNLFTGQGHVRTIMLYTDTHINVNKISFKSCPTSACRLIDVKDELAINQSTVLMFRFDKIESYPNVDWLIRSKQYWVVYSHESPCNNNKKWKKTVHDDVFNYTYTYRRGMMLFYPFGRATKKLEKIEIGKFKMETMERVIRKTKGALVYISSKWSYGYDRLEVARQLQKYIDVDVFGSLTGRIPCTRMDFYCEAKLHTQYRFYLSFENSLCTDYITEKFWNRLKSEALLVPVAIGGLSLDEYTDVTPPNSFIHALNFSSISELGKYLSRLMTNDEEYMAYHQWRKDYDVITLNQLCEICALAHSGLYQNALTNVTDWWNENTCESLDVLMSQQRQGYT